MAVPLAGGLILAVWLAVVLTGGRQRSFWLLAALFGVAVAMAPHVIDIDGYVWVFIIAGWCLGCFVAAFAGMFVWLRRAMRSDS